VGTRALFDASPGATTVGRGRDRRAGGHMEQRAARDAGASDRLAVGIVTALQEGHLEVFDEFVVTALDRDPAGVIEALAVLAAGRGDASEGTTGDDVSVVLQALARAR
jgi:hypothetical protein